MRPRMLLAAALVLGGASTALTGGVAKSEPKLQGTWKLVALQRGDKKAPDEVIQKINRKLTIKGDKISFSGGDGKSFEGTVKVDPTRTPRHIDISAEVPDKGPLTAQGIYELTGDTLKLSMRRSERPANFDKEVETYKRVTE